MDAVKVKSKDDGVTERAREIDGQIDDAMSYLRSAKRWIKRLDFESAIDDLEDIYNQDLLQEIVEALREVAEMRGDEARPS